MKKNLILFSLILLLGSSSAQNFVGKLNPFPMASSNQKVQSGDLKILAVIVDFKADEDNTTFGDGKFGSIYSEDYGNDIIDPLPHDAQYFRDHLQFAKNYFNKVSNGKQNIDYTVLDQVFTLPKTMRDYSPNPQDNGDFLPLANFAKDVWTLVDQSGLEINFADYDLFTIFHAGVGRDIEVPGSIGNDRDLPSVYLSFNALKNSLGENFEGYSVSNGQFKITNTMILPETESRELSSIGGTVLLELSINGLIAASIASHLGLPDLFNTETGLSAIGRFGLMDGQSIFTFGGLFPPEPSPWEKIFLGWVEPVEINDTHIKINLSAERVATIADTSLVKIPINSSEYYLVENRSRDALSDGCKITYKVNGQTFTKTFDRDAESFIYYSVDTLQGVVVDVDEFDWAVPAFDRNEEDLSKFSDIGIVIWHIDENVIEENLAANTVNNDKFRKGVAVVEADGIYDIGEEFQTIFGDVIIGEGSKEDTWYSGNPSELYKNVFNDNSKPSAKANTGANSLLKMSEFSAVAPKMSFKLNYGSGSINLVARHEIPYPSPFKWINNFNYNSTDYLLLSDYDKLLVTDIEGKDNRSVTLTIDFKPAVVSFNDVPYFITSDGKTINVIKYVGNNFEFSSFDESSEITTPIIVSNSSTSIAFMFGNKAGEIVEKEFTAQGQLIEAGRTKIFQSPVVQISGNGQFLSAITVTEYWDNIDGQFQLPVVASSLMSTESNGLYYSVVTLEDNSFIITGNGSYKLYSNLNSVNGSVNFSMSDLKSDGSNYIIANTGSTIEAFNLHGGNAEYFPIKAPENTTFSKNVLSADINNDNYGDLIVSTEDGRIYAYSGKDASIISPFPVSTGRKLESNALIYNFGLETFLSMHVAPGTFYVWSLGNSVDKVYWSDTYNANNGAFLDAAQNVNYVSTFFPKNKAYNWPNPVYDNQTYFRFYTSEDADVEITIFDLAGDLVSKIKEKASGGFDNEIAWNVTDVQSGVYFAHLNIESVTGKKDYKIIKVAVIK